MGFEIFAYSKDYYHNGKYIGNVVLEEKDRETIGYAGRTNETLQQDTIFKKKTFRAGTIVTTELVPLCGRQK
jgi:hypothetical protein